MPTTRLAVYMSDRSCMPRVIDAWSHQARLFFGNLADEILKRQGRFDEASQSSARRFIVIAEGNFLWRAPVASRDANQTV
jgi:hypothetical protein